MRMYTATEEGVFILQWRAPGGGGQSSDPFLPSLCSIWYPSSDGKGVRQGLLSKNDGFSLQPALRGTSPSILPPTTGLPALLTSCLFSVLMA